MGTPRQNVTFPSNGGTAHGYLYLVYLVVTADLGLRLRWPLVRLLLIAVAGTVPFCSFIAERKVTRLVRREQREVSAPGEPQPAPGADR